LSSRTVIVNQAFARKFFPNVNPVGRQITYSSDRINCQVVGVVGDVRSGVDETGAEEELYLPLSQRPWLVAKLLVRTSVPEGVATAIRAGVQKADPEQSVAAPIPFEQVISEDMRRPRTTMFAVMIFAISALLLAAIGTYGLIAYSVAQRRKEIGIRIALGANGGQIRYMVIKQTLRLLTLGLIIGLPLSLLLGQLYAGMLFDVQPTDPTILATVITLLLAVGLAATYFPAARAARTNPIIVLRVD
jgi:putative ABC transport system permease protein